MPAGASFLSDAPIKTLRATGEFGFIYRVYACGWSENDFCSLRACLKMTLIRP
jgi:hypothetical protein